MKRVISILVFFLLGASAAVADVSVFILKGTAVSEKKAALFVSVVDDAGVPVKGLSKGQFELSVGGERIEEFKVEPVSATQEPLSIVLAIDVSGSMKGAPFNETKEAVSIFLDQLDRGDHVSLLKFGTGVRFLTDFTNKRHEVRGQVELLRAVDNWTHLYDATYKAINKAKEAPTTRVAAVLITDGMATGEQIRTRKDAIDIAQGASVPVFTVGFGHKIDEKYLKEIAEVSNGYFFFTPRPEEIPHLYTKILDQLKNQYLIEFPFPKEPGPYKASLTLSYEGRTVHATKAFRFIPVGVPQPIIPRLGYFIIGGAILLGIIGGAILLILSRKKQKLPEDVVRKVVDRFDEIIDKKAECWLEFPGETPTAMAFVESKGSKTRKMATLAQNIFLKVNGLKRPVPLVREEMEIITELFIARYEEKRKQYRNKDAVYLWTSNKYVSAPNESRYAHARLFLDEKTERFMIEDLGSANGTSVRGKKIGKKEPFLLQDGDIIEIGGKEGIMITYMEGGGEEASEEGGTIIGNL